MIDVTARSSAALNQYWTGEEVDGEAGGAYDPQLYSTLRAAGTDHVGLDIDDQLWLDRYAERGFLSIARAYSPQAVSAASAGIDRLISGDVPAFRGIQWEAKARDKLGQSSIDERRAWVRKLIYYVGYDARLAAMAQDPSLLRALEMILGGKPVLFADQALLKPPGIGREKPWHQDLAFFDVRPGAPVVGVWIALDRATTDNGCMHVIPGSHRSGPVVHFKRRDFQICDTDVERAVITAVPLDPGGCMIFDGLLHHGTPMNNSPLRRWALQFHYAREEDIWRSSEERMAYKEQRLSVFGSEGKNVTC